MLNTIGRPQRVSNIHYLVSGGAQCVHNVHKGGPRVLESFDVVP